MKLKELLGCELYYIISLKPDVDMINFSAICESVCMEGDKSSLKQMESVTKYMVDRMY